MAGTQFSGRWMRKPGGADAAGVSAGGHFGCLGQGSQRGLAITDDTAAGGLGQAVKLIECDSPTKSHHAGWPFIESLLAERGGVNSAPISLINAASFRAGLKIQCANVARFLLVLGFLVEENLDQQVGGFAGARTPDDVAAAGVSSLPGSAAPKNLSCCLSSAGQAPRGTRAAVAAATWSRAPGLPVTRGAARWRRRGERRPCR